MPLTPAPSSHSFDEVKKEACFILGLLAVKPEFQAAIASAGALPGLVKLLRAHKPTAVTRVVPGSGGVARRAADAITNLAHENVDIKVGGGVWRGKGDWVVAVGCLLPVSVLPRARQRRRAGPQLARTRNPPFQNRVRAEGGIPPLVALLEAWDIKVQRAGAGALRTLAFKNEENKKQIVECGALPLLIQVCAARGGGRLCLAAAPGARG